VNIKSVDVIAKKYASRGGTAGPDYADGVNTTQTDWATETANAADTYATGVQAAIGRGAFAKGVQNAGTDKWKRKAAGVGAQRFASGVQAAAPDYAKGVAPFLDTLRSLSLPKRLPKGDPGNNARSLAVQQALRAKKVSG
jgi:hypothetical protein